MRTSTTSCKKRDVFLHPSFCGSSSVTSPATVDVWLWWTILFILAYNHLIRNNVLILYNVCIVTQFRTFITWQWHCLIIAAYIRVNWQLHVIYGCDEEMLFIHTMCEFFVEMKKMHSHCTCLWRSRHSTKIEYSYVISLLQFQETALHNDRTRSDRIG